MTEPLIAHVRFSDHIARCPWCLRNPNGLCEWGRHLLVSWQEAENLATKQAQEADRAAHIEAVSDATGYADDCAEEGGRPDYDALRETYDL